MASWAAIALAVSACDKSEKAAAPGTNSPAASVATPTAPSAKSGNTPAPSAPSSAQAKARYATVDLQRVMTTSRLALASQERTKAVQAAVMKELEQRKARIGEVVGEYEALKKRAESFSGTPVEGRQLQLALDWRKGVMQALENDRKEFIQRRNKVLKLRSNAEVAKLLKDVRGPMDELSNSKGYAWVIDRSGINTNQVPMVVYVKSDVPDLTDELIRILDAKHPELPAAKTLPVSK